MFKFFQRSLVVVVFCALNFLLRFLMFVFFSANNYFFFLNFSIQNFFSLRFRRDPQTECLELFWKVAWQLVLPYSGKIGLNCAVIVKFFPIVWRAFDHASFRHHHHHQLHMTYTVTFKIQLKWFDSRIIFRNLKSTDILEIEKIWTPKLYIEHSNNIYMEAGQKSQEGVGTVRIHRNGSPKENE